MSITQYWHNATKEHDFQGHIYELSTGNNIAVTYDLEDAKLVAAAPELLEALENLVKMHDLEPKMLTDDDWQYARDAIRKATE